VEAIVSKKGLREESKGKEVGGGAGLECIKLRRCISGLWRGGRFCDKGGSDGDVEKMDGEDDELVGGAGSERLGAGTCASEPCGKGGGEEMRAM
jgi:hypothetical protein